jgi:hypothetical protein
LFERTVAGEAAFAKNRLNLLSVKLVAGIRGESDYRDEQEGGSNCEWDVAANTGER